MLSNSQQKFLTSLHVKKYRQKYRNFLVEGAKIVGELLQQQRFGVVSIWGTERWAADNAALLAPHLDRFNAVTDDELRKVGTLATPNQVLAVASPPQPPRWGGDGLDDSTLTASLLLSETKLDQGAAAAPTGAVAGFPPNGGASGGVGLYLAGLQDPGNLGTILRIADWFGLPGVWCSPDCVDAFSPKVIQAGMGACLRVPVFEDVQLADLVQNTPGLAVVGAVMDGENVFQTVLPTRALLVIGNEGRGIPADVEALLTHRVTIPRGVANSGAESLNAGVAAGILVAQFVKK